MTAKPSLEFRDTRTSASQAEKSELNPSCCEITAKKVNLLKCSYSMEAKSSVPWVLTRERKLSLFLHMGVRGLASFSSPLKLRPCVELGRDPRYQASSLSHLHWMKEVVYVDGFELLPLHSNVQTLRNSRWLVPFFRWIRSTTNLFFRLTILFTSLLPPQSLFPQTNFLFRVSSRLPSFSILDSTSSSLTWHFLASHYHHSLSYSHLVFTPSTDTQEPASWILLCLLRWSQRPQIT